jgi:hypothetical protein
MNLWTVVLTILVVPSMVFGASLHQFKVAEATANADNLVVVPLSITNPDDLAGMDIPLSFSEGLTLKEVTFEGTRVEYFDLKVANIDNEKGTVVIGLLPQMTDEYKPDLKAGEGVVANLLFEVNDLSVTEIVLEELKTAAPAHSLTFVYRDGDEIIAEHPEFETVTVAFSNAPGVALPTEFSLSQNYPNPFNPSTTLEFALPTPSHVNLTVYNLLGQTVETVVDENLTAGLHAYDWNASNVASGVYFYRLVTDKNTETRKMMLLK